MNKSILLLFCSILSFSVYAQITPPKNDSIPAAIPMDSVALDTAIVGTILIRSIQEQIKIIPRGARLANPYLSFKKTKAISKKIKRFRVPSFWERVNELKVNFSEVAFVNWNAGGDNSVAANGIASFERNYKFRYIQWENDLRIQYGINQQEGKKLRKTDDAIRISSTFGYRRDTISNWYYSVKANFNTQFSAGYKYPNRENPISTFMAPGYLFIGAGASYIPEGQNFNLYISPLTQKATFVLDEALANRGAFGVDKAVLDSEGNVITPGKRNVMELGFLITNSWEKEIFKNINMKHRISLYTDYLNSFGNIDLDWELNFELVVNKFITTTIGTHMIYDDDIKFDEVKADNGTIITPGVTKIQFKQMLGIGIGYRF